MSQQSLTKGSSRKQFIFARKKSIRLSSRFGTWTSALSDKVKNDALFMQTIHLCVPPTPMMALTTSKNTEWLRYYQTSKTPCWRWTSDCALYVRCDARVPLMTCENLWKSVDPSPTTCWIRTLSAQTFLRYRKWVCTCTHAHVNLVPFMETPQLIGPQPHTKFEPNWPSCS